jgi:hypothetical protein
MKYKINDNQFVTDYNLACVLTTGNIQVFDGEEMIDTIDFETAKQGVNNLEQLNLIKEQ